MNEGILIPAPVDVDAPKKKRDRKNPKKPRPARTKKEQKAKAFRSMNKFGALRSGHYASKREHQYAEVLREQKKNGEILDHLEQVPIYLPGGTRYVVDFMIIHNNGTISFVEVKGVVTDVFKIKIRMLQETRPEIWNRLTIVK